MRNRNAHLAPLALAALAIAATAACATSPSTARVREEREPLVAREVVVRVMVEADGSVVITPDRAIVRSGQKLVIFTCCDPLSIHWKRAESRIPEPICRGGECSLVGPDVKDPVEIDYFVTGKCGDKPFKTDPRLIFIK